MHAQHRRRENSDSILSTPLFIFALLVGGINSWIWNGKQQADDLASLWIAGILEKSGQISHIYDRNPTDFAYPAGKAWKLAIKSADIKDLAPFPHPFVHAPLFARFMGFLTEIMSFEFALWLLTALSSMCVVLLIAASYNLWWRKQLPMCWAIPLTIAFLLSAPVQQTIWLGQTSLLILTAAICAVASVRRHPLLTGIILAVITLIKITPLILIGALVLFKPTRKAFYYALSSLGIISAVALLLDYTLTLKWLDELGTVSSAAILTGANLSPFSWFTRNLNTSTNPKVLAPFIADPDTTAALWLTLAALVFVVGYLVISHFIPAYNYEIVAIGSFSIAMLIANILWIHYLVIAPVLIAGILFFAHRLSSTIYTGFIGAASIAAGLLFYPVADSGGEGMEFNKILMPYAGLWSLLILVLTFTVVTAWIALADAKPTKKNTQPTAVTPLSS